MSNNQTSSTTTTTTTTGETSSSLSSTKKQRQRRQRFAVKKLIRYTNGRKYDTVALYDADGHFRGWAIFESEDEAKRYAKVYKEKLNNRLLDKFGRHKSSTSLKVFVEEDEEDKEIIK